MYNNEMSSAYIASIIGYFAAIIGIFTFIPQAYDIWKTKSTKGISLLTFVLIVFMSILWIIYGVLLQAFPILLVNIVVLFLASYIVFMKFKYK